MCCRVAVRERVYKEALAVATQIRGSAQKLNLVAGLIRGRKAGDALNILAFSKKGMAIDARKVLASRLRGRTAAPASPSPSTSGVA